MVSRMPPISPARTSCTKRSSKTLGCSDSASAKVEPASTLAFTCSSTERKAALSFWVPRMSSAWTSGRPASIITENCRVKTRMSLVPTPLPSLGMRSSRGFFLTLVGSMPIWRSRASTDAASWASISPERTSPCLLFPVHFQTGVFCTGVATLVFCATAAACAMYASLVGGCGC